MPLSYDAGEACQFDWCECHAAINGEKRKVAVFCAVLCYSYQVFAAVFPDQSTASLAEGHVMAFEYFGGVPRRGIYDNMKTAVLSGSGANAAMQPQFQRIVAHYAFQPDFCNAASGNEKGLVENLCGIAEKRFFTPAPSAGGIGELQEMLSARVQEYNSTHKPRTRKRSIAEMYGEERLALAPLPLRRLEGHKTVEAKVGPDLCFTHAGVKYSLPQEHVGKTVTLRIFAYRIEALREGKLIFAHRRPFGRLEHQYIPAHYLTLLEKRRRAVGNAKPLKEGVLPDELELFKKLCAEPDMLQQLCELLILARDVGEDPVLKAVGAANKGGKPTFGKAGRILGATRAPQDAPELGEPCLDGYDTLISGGEGSPAAPGGQPGGEAAPRG
jgi:hypothetical protein